ncbi:LytTR family DNA-binding domain-containing protein [Chelativorans sp.]|uniref:LytTR family DNA-binding domain-containing protein n=1 Tax=Chelativorans sp. TaxID=2203393 RepID=UPI0028122AA9|nr:LytTR family DNA-binding domain-containing protein [Chelativorans sp.]
MAACIVAGLAFGIVGPFGTFLNGSLPTVMAYWTAVLMLSGIVLGLFVRFACAWAHYRRLPPWIWMAGILIVSAPPLAIMSRTLAVTLWPEVDTSVGWIEWHGQTLAISAICLLLYVAFRFRTLWPLPSREGVAVAPHWTARLSPQLRRSVICLQMEDHYVRFHTRSGSKLLLMPLGQAIAQLDAVDGLQVHRSWWVARHAVEGVIRDGRNLRLRLTTGIEAPVARAKVATLRSAGWLPPVLPMSNHQERDTA